MADSSEQQQSEPVCNFFRKPSKNKNIRKRTFDENEGNDEDSKPESSIIPNKKKPPMRDNKLHFSTGPSKRSMTSESEKSEAKIFQFESSKEIQVQNDSRATATLDTETDFSRDARAIRERVLKQAEDALKGKNKSNTSDEKLYKGIHGYTDYKAGFRREQTVASEKAGGSHGPLRASAHIRVSARFDYQPDICKDYKETGYCGYGDACKFMHDRGDYKPGWQLEKEWDEAEKARKRNLALGGDDSDEEGADQIDEDEDSLPFACFICRQPFVDPVATKCKHYFCEHCALKIHTKKRNRLEHKRLNALVYVKYNLKLRERSIKRRDKVDPIIVDEIDSDDEWITEKEDPVLPKDTSWLEDDELFSGDPIVSLPPEMIDSGLESQQPIIDVDSSPVSKKRKVGESSSGDKGKEVRLTTVDEDVEIEDFEGIAPGNFDSGNFPHIDTLDDDDSDIMLDDGDYF